MARRGSRVSLAEKHLIADQALTGASDREIAQALDRSFYTIRKWRRQFTAQGRSGFESKMGRPPSGILGSYSAELRAALLALRKAHPGWGPKTLLMELKQDAYWGPQKLPSRTQLAAYLRQEGLVRRYERHSELPQPAPQDVERPHQEWQMDAQGSLKISSNSKYGKSRY